MNDRITLDSPEDFLTYRQGSGTTCEIADIAVGTERRAGKGRKLVDELIHRLEGSGTTLVWAITRKSNVIAQEFYMGIGFRLIATLPDFYRTEDAIMYGRDIK